VTLKILGSNSAGNCYLLENENECLVIELGVKFMDIKKAINFQLSKIVGALVTHEHGDHSCAVADALKAGLKVYASAGTHKILGTSEHHRSKTLKAFTETQIGSFKILPFDTRHDCAEPLGFMINHEETGNILFLTDTIYSPYTFTGLNNLIVECNYSKEIIDNRVLDGKTQKFLRDRVINSHMNLETLQSLLSANDLTAVNNIVLIHLSDSHSHEAAFHTAITNQTAKKVTVATAGLVLENFNKTPF
jgi:phosphoribosyl 1,2-cyclic phosphodiesterase